MAEEQLVLKQCPGGEHERGGPGHGAGEGEALGPRHGGGGGGGEVAGEGVFVHAGGTEGTLLSIFRLYWHKLYYVST